MSLYSMKTGLTLFITQSKQDPLNKHRRDTPLCEKRNTLLAELAQAMNEAVRATNELKQTGSLGSLLRANEKQKCLRFEIQTIDEKLREIYGDESSGRPNLLLRH